MYKHGKIKLFLETLEYFKNVNFNKEILKELIDVTFEESKDIDLFEIDERSERGLKQQTPPPLPLIKTNLDDDENVNWFDLFKPIEKRSERVNEIIEIETTEVIESLRKERIELLSKLKNPKDLTKGIEICLRNKLAEVDRKLEEPFLKAIEQKPKANPDGLKWGEIPKNHVCNHWPTCAFCGKVDVEPEIDYNEFKLGDELYSPSLNFNAILRKDQSGYYVGNVDTRFIFEHGKGDWLLVK